jgi:hypothetical protein
VGVQRETGARDDVPARAVPEGTRPCLPWATGVGAPLAHPEATLPILDVFYRDDIAYVRRSVAIRLNDLSRHGPALAVDTAARWLTHPAPTTPQLVRAPPTDARQAGRGERPAQGPDASAKMVRFFLEVAQLR